MYQFRIVCVFIAFFALQFESQNCQQNKKMLYFYDEKKILRKSDGKMCKMRIYTNNGSFSTRNDLKATCWTLYHITSNENAAIYNVNRI